MELEVALLLLELLGVEKRRGIQGGAQGGFEFPEQTAAPRHQARFQQGGLDRDVLGGLLQALGNRADAVSHFQPDVPHQADHGFQLRGQLGVGRFGQKDQQVDVGAGKKLAPPISADGCQRHALNGRNFFQDLAQDLVHQPAVAPQQAGGRARLEVALAQAGSRLRQELLAVG